MVFRVQISRKTISQRYRWRFTNSTASGLLFYKIREELIGTKMEGAQQVKSLCA